MRLTFHDHASIDVPARLVLAGGRGRLSLAVRYGVLERAGQRPVLIDAGWPARQAWEGVALRLYRAMLRPRVNPAAAPAVVLAGRMPCAILLSHLHADHLGALADFPAAPVHASQSAWENARRRPLRALRHGALRALLPDTVIDMPTNVPLPYDLGTGHDVLGDGSVLSVPLPGHADGHTGFLFPAFDPPVLYAADVQWVWAALRDRRPPSGPARAVYADQQAAMESLDRVRAFSWAGGRVVLCHDPTPVPAFVT